MKSIMKKVGILLGVMILYMIMFATFTKVTGILTLLSGVCGTYYLYFRNMKFKRKGKICKKYIWYLYHLFTTYFWDWRD